MRVLLLLTMVLSLSVAKASHVPGGNVTYEYLGNGQYYLTLTLFEDCAAGFITNAPQTVTADNDCGLPSQTIQLNNTVHQLEISNLCPANLPQTTCSGGNIPGYYMHQFEGVISLPDTCNAWYFSHTSCCLNTTTNVSGQPQYYWEAALYSTNDSTNNSAVPLNQVGIPLLCTNDTMTVDHAFFDPDGDSLAFSLVDGLTGPGAPMMYNFPYSGSQPTPYASIDPATGAIDFHSTVVGNFVVSIFVEEYENGQLVGTSNVLLQVYFVTCLGVNDEPVFGSISNYTGPGSITGPNEITECGGSSFCFDLDLSDINVADTLDVISTIDAYFPGATITITGTNPIVANVCGTVPSNASGTYEVDFHGYDNGCPLIGNDYMHVNFIIDPGSQVVQDQSICLGQSVQLANGAGAGTTWTSIAGDPVNVGVNFSCNPCGSPVATPSQTTTYVASLSPAVCGANADTVTITVFPGFTYTLADTVASCVSFTIDPDPSPWTNYQYTWSDGGGVLSVDSMVTETDLPIGSYMLYLSMSNGSCTIMDSIFVSNSNTSISIGGDTLVCVNEDAQLQALGTGTTFIQDSFTTGIDFSNWSAISNGLTGQVGCGGQALYFDGATGARSATTVAMNAITVATIDFCLFLGNDLSTPAPCENMDVNEDVVLEYSIDGGTNWFTFATYLQSDWDAAGIYANTWQCFSVPIPPIAQTSSTMFRWIQPVFSACAGCDNWSLDEVLIQGAGTGGAFLYNWTGANLNSTTIADPIASPPSGWYYVTVTDSLNPACSWTDSVEVIIDTVDAEVFLSDSSLCDGDTIFLTSTIDGMPNTGQGYDYEWNGSTVSDPSLVNSFAVVTAPIFFGDYIVIDSITGCTDTVTVGAAVNFAPSVGAIDGPGVVQVSSTGNQYYYTGPGSGYAYNWTVIGGTITSGQGTDTIYVDWGAAGTGQVDLDLTAIAFCTVDTMLSFLVDIGGVGIADPAESIFLVYPNPANDELFVRVPQKSAGMYQVLDAVGRVVLSTSLEIGVNPINTSKLAPGTYTMMHISSGRVMMFSINR